MSRLFSISSIPLALLVTSVLRYRATETYLASQTYEDIYYLPPPDWLPVLSLGYDSALADLIWMRALVYFGEETGEGGAMAHIFDYSEAMLALDPDFREVYHWIATAGMYHPQAITAEDVYRSLAIMRRGQERWPDDGELAWDIGTTLAFELPPLLSDPDERDAARSEGADYMAMASRLGAAPEWVALSSASILNRVGRADAAIRHLEETYATISDEATKARILDAIQNLAGQARASGIEQANQDEERRRLAELPYLSPDLYFIAGPKPVIDWRATYRNGFHMGVLEGPSESLGAPSESLGGPSESLDAPSETLGAPSESPHE